MTNRKWLQRESDRLWRQAAKKVLEAQNIDQLLGIEDRIDSIREEMKKTDQLLTDFKNRDWTTF